MTKHMLQDTVTYFEIKKNFFKNLFKSFSELKMYRSVEI